MMKQLLDIDYEDLEVRDLINIYSQSISLHNRPMCRDLSSEGLFRARIINNTKDDELERAKCIWYPDWSEINEEYQTYNRCSDKGENFFYASNSLEATIREMNPNDGDRLLVGIFNRTNPRVVIPSQFAGIERLKKMQYFDRILSNYEYHQDSDKKFEEWITSFFTREISSGEENYYKPSIAFSKILLANENIKCLIYPSVASDYKMVNFGIKPDFVDENLRCRGAYIYRVAKSENYLRIKPEKYSKSVMEDRSNPKNSLFEWENNSLEERDIVLNSAI